MQTAQLSTRSRVFMNGNSQAVRIPLNYRLETDEVEIFRNADGDLVLHALPMQKPHRGAALLQVLQGFDPEFIAALEEAQQDALPMQERESL
jgi:antitoxin VapB